MSNRTLVNLPLAVPAFLKDWADTESKNSGLSRNAFLIHKLMLMRETQSQERLRRLEVRVTELERVNRNGVLH